MDSLHQFEQNLREEDHSYVLRLNEELNAAISKILQGNTESKPTKDPPKLVIHLDDKQLEDNVDLFLQLVNKHYAVERYQIYREVQKIN